MCLIDKITGISASTMDEGDESDVLTFFKTFMSSKTKEEQQREIFNYLKSNPNSLHTLIRNLIEKYNKTVVSSQMDDKMQNSATTVDKEKSLRLYDINVTPSELLLSSTGDNEESITYDGYVSNISTTRTDRTKTVIARRCSLDIPNTKNNQGYQPQPTNKRKSKYGDIQGDLSHIYREPKRGKLNAKAKKEKKI